ncbi:uncharacterized protein METZ01_LOCUS437160, partial [marine metagenome]
PLDASEWADSDGDGVGDNRDVFPGDADETLDTDGDGIGDNGDAYPFDATKWEEEADIVLFVLTAVVVVMLGLLVYTGRKNDSDS